MNDFYLSNVFESASPAYCSFTKHVLCKEWKNELKMSDRYKDLAFRKELYYQITEPQEWVHFNIWNFPYRVKFDKADINVYWFEYYDLQYNEKVYQRFVSYSVKNFCYFSIFSNEWVKFDSFWGNPDLIAINGDKIQTLVAFPEKRFETLEEFENDMPQKCIVDFQPLCNEILADG